MNIDSCLIDKCEKFSHRTQRLVGIDCFVLARICMWLAGAPFATSIALHNVPVMPLWLKISLPPLGVISWWISEVFLGYWTKIPDLERDTYKSLNNGMKNPYVIHGKEARYTRLTFIFIVPVIVWGSLFGIVWLGYLLTVTIHALTLYFASCTPLPPSKSWLRKTLGKLKSALTPAPALPEPIPA